MWTFRTTYPCPPWRRHRPGRAPAPAIPVRHPSQARIRLFQVPARPGPSSRPAGPPADPLLHRGRARAAAAARPGAARTVRISPRGRARRVAVPRRAHAAVSAAEAGTQGLAAIAELSPRLCAERSGTCLGDGGEAGPPAPPPRASGPAASSKRPLGPGSGWSMRCSRGVLPSRRPSRRCRHDRGGFGRRGEFGPP